MASEGEITQKFYQADVNHDGGIDQGEFRHFVSSGGPPGGIPRAQPADYQAAAHSGVTETISYPIGLDVGVAGFTANPASYERFAGAISGTERHGYGVGPDVAVGAPNHPVEAKQYDPAGAMFNYADVNHDGKIDRGEFGSFMHSV